MAAPDAFYEVVLRDARRHDDALADARTFEHVAFFQTEDEAFAWIEANRTVRAYAPCCFFILRCRTMTGVGAAPARVPVAATEATPTRRFSTRRTAL